MDCKKGYSPLHSLVFLYYPAVTLGGDLLMKGTTFPPMEVNSYFSASGCLHYTAETFNFSLKRSTFTFKLPFN